MSMGKENKPPENYVVGYRKPPMQTRFKKGKSGNPKGRPKGSLNLATVLMKTLREKVVVNENGRKKKITKLEAAIKQLVHKAVQGDPRASPQLMALTLSVEQSTPQETSPKDVLNELDKKVVISTLKRYEKSINGGTKDEKSKD
jgi:Family of unknown function (DUF5681)